MITDIMMIGTIYVLVGMVIVFGAMSIHLIQRYFKAKDNPGLYMGFVCIFMALAAIFGILIAAVTPASNLPLAALFHRISTTLGVSACVFLNIFSVAVTNSDEKRGILLSMPPFIIITFIVWAFNPVLDGVIGGTMNFTLTSMYKAPYGLPLIEIILICMTIIAVYPIYLFFRTAKDSKARIVKIKSILIGIGLFIAIATYSIQIAGAISYVYMPIYRPMIFVGALILFFGYETPKWVETKLAGSAPMDEKSVRSPLEEFLVPPVAPKARSELGAFSNNIRLNHQQMAGRKILLEFNPASNYEKPIQDFALEALANTEPIIIFTRLGSSIHSSLREYANVKFFCLTQQFSIPKESSENEMLLPSGDTSLILDVLDKALKSNPEGSINIIFDNLSDILLSIGFDKTYRFIRYAVEMLASPRNTILFLINQTAHDPNVMSSLKGLFSDQVTYEKDGLHTIKLHESPLQPY